LYKEHTVTETQNCEQSQIGS